MLCISAQTISIDSLAVAFAVSQAIAILDALACLNVALQVIAHVDYVAIVIHKVEHKVAMWMLVVMMTNNQILSVADIHLAHPFPR
jgi:hypothetical protein